MLSLFMNAVRKREDSDKKAPWSGAGIIETHLKSKLIFSVGQRTGYGNKERDVIKSSGI